MKRSRPLLLLGSPHLPLFDIWVLAKGLRLSTLGIKLILVLDLPSATDYLGLPIKLSNTKFI